MEEVGWRVSVVAGVFCAIIFQFMVVAEVFAEDLGRLAASCSTFAPSSRVTEQMPNPWIGQEVLVFRNINNGRWSIWSAKSPRRLLFHADSLELGSVRFWVSEAGRQRVLRTGRKSLHAGLIGTLTRVTEQMPKSHRGWVRLRYNPREMGSFQGAESKKAVFFASRAHLTEKSQVFALSPRESLE